MAEPVPANPAEHEDVRPVVGRPSGNRGVWIFAAILLAVGGGIFYALQMRRLTMQEASLLDPQLAAQGMIASPPELNIPPAPDYAEYGQQPNARQEPGTATGIPAPVRIPRPVTYYDPAPPTPAAPPNASQPPVAPVGPGYAYQASQPPLATAGESGAGKPADGRVEARHFKNPGTTVPQGSVIQAVMETALDSTRAGFARAIVSRDVESFDGTRVLIPKGSRLFGDYEADVSLGQKRALIQWKRLTRPDGTIIDLDSPSADPLGRAGVKGKVNTHFFQRFSGAILQSFLDVGVRAATEKATGNTVIVGLPGATTQTPMIQSPADIKPTLKIAQGASVSVFVARDLDFTAVER